MDYCLKNDIKIKTRGKILIIDKSESILSNTKMFIKIDNISGCILLEGMLLVLGSGIPICNEFKNHNIEYIKRLPNCIIGTKDELEEIYEEISLLIENIPAI
ncbi:hypothetical protein ACED96_11240 [Clostridium thermobutyricum]|uniref:Uncharacterized protein n=1 Tax=Clostridium thermobutyricum DSM 4928 TaxID=1121339 RepID=A0A1V4SX02_9CLOT|nr:hypothetical protein [Clostridium thermobutyricum]OPX49103.1 hypothetical protein CLTHE_08570 [Clostridium thermobutyricum DSM 4928]